MGRGGALRTDKPDIKEKQLLEKNLNEDNDPEAIRKRKNGMGIYYRIVIIIVSLLPSSLWASFFANGIIADYLVGYYSADSSCFDVALLEWLLSLLFIIVALVNKEMVIILMQFFVVWSFSLLGSKLWIYRGWKHKESAADSAGFIFTMITVVIRLVLLFKLSEKEVTPLVSLEWSSTKTIIRPYLMPHGLRNKILVALTWLALACNKACGIISPIVLGTIVTNLSQFPNPDPSYKLIAIFTVLNILPRIFTEIQDVLYVKVWQIAFTQVADTTFRHIHGLSLEWHLKKKLGDVVRSINRGQQAADSLMYYTMVYLVPAVGSAIAAFVVFAVHFDQPLIAGVCFLGFYTYCWLTFVVTLWRRKFRQEMNKHDNEMNQRISDSLINFETVKYFTNENHEAEEFYKCTQNYQQGNFKTQTSVSILNTSQTISIQVSMLGSLLLAAYAIAHQTGSSVISAGTFVAVMQYVNTIFQPLSALGGIYNTIINSLVDIQNLSSLLAEQPDVIDAPNARLFVSPKDASSSGVSIEFRNVYFRYPTQKDSHGISDISFTVPAGTMTAVVGQTGSGKTTLGRLLFRFYDVLSGGVYLNGIDVRDVTQNSLRKAMGVVPQDTVLFNDTIAYNIRYGKLSATDEEIREAAHKAQIDTFIEQLELKYQTAVGERGLKLSGGEKQRVAIARCLLKDPLVVLLDEATSSLDNKTEKELQDALQALHGRTTLIIAHRLTTVVHANQILVMRNGRIIERGTHEELLARGPSGYYYEIWNAQLTESVTSNSNNNESNNSSNT